MSKKIPPMPAPYTDVPNGMPVGVWKPGMYHSTAYIEWQRKYGTLFSTPKASDIEVPLTTPDEWNLSFGKRAAQRQCVSCDGWFTPVGKQIT